MKTKERKDCLIVLKHAKAIAWANNLNLTLITAPTAFKLLGLEQNKGTMQFKTIQDVLVFLDGYELGMRT